MTYYQQPTTWKPGDDVVVGGGSEKPKRTTLREALADFIVENDIGYGARAGSDMLWDADAIIDFIRRWDREKASADLNRRKP